MSKIQEFNNKKEVRAVKKVAIDAVKDENNYKALLGMGAIAGLIYTNKKMGDFIFEDIKRRARNISEAENLGEGFIQAGIIGLDITAGLIGAGLSVVIGNKLYETNKVSAKEFNDSIESKYREAIYEIEEEEFEIDEF